MGETPVNRTGENRCCRIIATDVASTTADIIRRRQIPAITCVCIEVATSSGPVGKTKTRIKKKEHCCGYNPFGREDYLARGRARPTVGRGRGGADSLPAVRA